MNDLSARLSFLRKALGSCDRSPDGLNYAFKCPNCGKSGSDKRKLIVKLDTGNYHCWVCDVKGRSPTTLIKKYKVSLLEECGRTFGDAIKYRNEDAKLQEIEKIELPMGFIPLTKGSASSDPDVAGVIRYARSRGLSNRDFWFYKLGTCSQGRFCRRLIIPSFNKDGELNFFVARSIDSVVGRKYLNSRVPKKSIIFNELNIDWKSELTLVEGPFDLMKCNDNATCILGSSLREDHEIFRKVVKNRTPVLLALDPDAEKKTHNYAKLLSEFDLTVRILNIDGYEDVGSMSREVFMNKRKDAPVWNSTDRLYHIIRDIKSGSVI